MKALIDANIIIDALQSRKGFAEDANFVILQAFGYDGYIAATSVPTSIMFNANIIKAKKRQKENSKKF